MSKKLIIVEVTDQEYASLLDNIARKAVAQDAANAVAEIASSEDGAPVAGAVGVIFDGAAERDDRGVVWNAKFHASTKTKKGDGSWTKRKGVSNAEIEAYEKQFIGAGVPAMVTSVPPVPASVVIAPTPVPVMPGLPGTAPVLPMPVAVIPPAPVDYNEVIAAYTDRVNAGLVGENPGQTSAAVLYAQAGIDPMTLQTDETSRAKLMNEFVKLGYVRAA